MITLHRMEFLNGLTLNGMLNNKNFWVWLIMNLGWISLHRKIQDHWIYEPCRPRTKFEAWIDIILQVNHAPEKVNIGHKLFPVDRGQSIKSLETWQRRWNWKSKKNVRDFLMLLKKDGMIGYENLTVSIRITVLNYNSYQNNSNALVTENKRSVNALETHRKPNNNINNENNINNGNDEFLERLVEE